MGGESGSGAGASSSFPPLTGGGTGERGDRNSGDIIVAKAEPSDAARRQTEQIQQEQLATALAGLNDVFFAYDSWKLTEEAKVALEQDAAWLKANPAKTMMIEGYCDERGTVAYNLVLGERRAKAARNYLIELGVEPGRLTAVSYGKERPFCKEHEESCYQQNRRAHLVLRVQ
jgi:peptidoglycan-associated lipoprotein